MHILRWLMKTALECLIKFTMDFNKKKPLNSVEKKNKSPICAARGSHNSSSTLKAIPLVISSSFFSLQCWSMRMSKVSYSSAEPSLWRWVSASSGFSMMSSFLRIWSHISLPFLATSFFCSWRSIPARKLQPKRRWASWGIW